MKTHRFLMISFLLMSGFSVYSAQEEFDLTVQDIQECFVQDNAQRHVKIVKDVSELSDSSITKLLNDNVVADKFVSKLRQVAQDHPENWLNIYFSNHVAFLLARKKLEKSFVVRSDSNSLNIFLALGSFAIEQKLSVREKQENEFNEYIKSVKYDDNNSILESYFIQYTTDFECEMNQELEKIEEEKQLNSTIYALALQYQELHNIYNEIQDVLHEDAQKKDYEKRTITNGK